MVVGKGAMVMISRAFELHGRQLDPDTHKQLLSLFLAYYEAHIADETIFYDDCLIALDTLATKGWQLAVCTNKFEHLARKLLAQLNATDRFCAITGGDTFDVKKPDPGHLIQTLGLCGGTRDRAIMVGDSTNDIIAAHKANIPSIGVDFGYCDVAPADMGADALIDGFDKLDAAVGHLASWV